MYKIDVDELPRRNETPDGYSQVFMGQNVSLQFAQLKAGRAPSSGHSHSNEQVVVVLKGAYVLQVGDEQVSLRAGDVVIIPPDVPHRSISVAEDSFVVDVFSPPRNQGS